MAPRTRSKRRRNDASTIYPSVEAASDSLSPLANGDNLSGNHEPKRIGHETDDPQSQEMETAAPHLYLVYGPDGRIMGRKPLRTPTPEPYDDLETYVAWYRKHYGEESYALVLGEQMVVPQTYDPDKYDPDGRMPWTPEPEPYDPETYAAWGRECFGEEWYELRTVMLEERNFYTRYDPVYEERQKALTIMEHKIEGRPFEPGLRAGGIRDVGWKQLWARLSKDLGIEISRKPASPTRSKDDDDSDTDLSGYNTYAPTPEPREPTPLPDDPWERLEYDRIRWHWDDERYHYERIFLKEAMIDGARRLREDEPGNRQREKELAEIEKVRYIPGTLMKSLEYEHRMKNFNLRAKGWTQEQIDAKNREDAAAAERWRKEMEEHRANSIFGRLTEEGLVAKRRAWDALGVSQEEQDEIIRRFVLQGKPGIPDPRRCHHETQPRASPPGHRKDTPCKTRGRRIRKNAVQSQKNIGQAARSREPAPRPAKPPASDCVPARSKRRRDTLDEPDNGTAQAQSGWRRSRRLARQPPEFSHETLQQHLDTHKTSGARTRGSRRSRQPAPVMSAKPQGVSKSRRGEGRPKRPAKQSRGRVT